MLILVLGANLPVMFIGWEGVGLCSYLLIGFWYENDANATAGRKAFIVNRIGDFGFLLGMFLLFWATKTLDFDDIAQRLDVARLAVGAAYVAAVLGRRAARRRRRHLPVPRRERQERADPALRLAARRDGGPDAGLRAHPRRHDGDRRRLHGLPAVVPRARSSTTALIVVATVGPLTALFAAIIGVRADRPQEGARVLDGEPARLHVRRRRHRQLDSPRSSTSSPTRSSRRACSSAPARSCTAWSTAARRRRATSRRWAACASTCRSRGSRS